MTKTHCLFIVFQERFSLFYSLFKEWFIDYFEKQSQHFRKFRFAFINLSQHKQNWNTCHIDIDNFQFTIDSS